MADHPIVFELDHQGEKWRFSYSATGLELFHAVKAKVALLVNSVDTELFWRDNDSDVVLETVADLETAIDFAKYNTQSACNLPCVHLTVGNEIDLPSPRGPIDGEAALAFLDAASASEGAARAEAIEGAAAAWGCPGGGARVAAAMAMANETTGRMEEWKRAHEASKKPLNLEDVVVQKIGEVLKFEKKFLEEQKLHRKCQDENEALTKEVATLRDDSETLIEWNSTLETQLSEAQVEIVSGKTDIRRLNNVILDNEVKQLSLEAELADLKLKLLESEERNSELTRESAERKWKIDWLEEQGDMAFMEDVIAAKNEKSTMPPHWGVDSAEEALELVTLLGQEPSDYDTWEAYAGALEDLRREGWQLKKKEGGEGDEKEDSIVDEGAEDEEEWTDGEEKKVIVNKEPSEKERERELRIREKTFEIKEKAFERLMAVYEVKMEEFGEMMMRMEKRVEKVEVA